MRMAEQIDQIVTKLECSKNNWIVTQAIAAWIGQKSLRDQMRYEVQGDNIYILQVWCTREYR